MDTKHLKDKLASGEDVMIIDVREHDEYEKGEKMDEATNIPMGQMFIEASQGKLPKDKKIITVCKSGTRCEIVARELKAKGYDIEHLEGGMDAWKAA
ncbi:MAG: rhodanese-like domain-containing protein [Candidatus Magasanikbacteria bacterium]|nr:rhodanese-like domain-containing protein [Candidatus Magasanikbacteria bacterium]